MHRFAPHLRVGFFSLAIGLVVSASAPGCNSDDKGDSADYALEIGSAVQLLATTQGDLAEQALRRLLPHGRAALPYLETALHTARSVGRKNLIVALRRLGLAESVPLLGHVASYDEDLVVAREAWQTLELWSSERSQRGEAARRVLPKFDEVRGTGALLLDP